MSGPGWRRWTGFVLAATAVAAVVLGRAFPEAFTGLSATDDTGYMLALIRGFNAHGELYARTYSQYGPFYSEFYAVVCRGLGVPATQDGIRWIAVATRLLCSIAGGALAFRLTGRLGFAVLAQMFCASVLSTLGLDAGHPIGLCCLCAGVAAVCVPLPGAGHPVSGDVNVGLAWRPVAFGAALGALTMVKINLGVFALASVGVAWAFGTPRDRVGCTLRWSAGVLLCLLPVLLVGGAWPVHPRLAFTALMLATLVGLLLVFERERSVMHWRGAIRLALSMISGWVLACALGVAGALATGSRLGDVLNGVLLRPLGMPGLFSVEPATSAGTLLAAAIALGGVLAWRFLLPVSPEGEVWRARVELGLRVAFLALAVLWFAVGKGYSFVLPFLWIVALPARPEAKAGGPFARRALAALAATGFLSLYPVAGVQVVVPGYLGAMAVVIVAAQVLGSRTTRASAGVPAAPFPRWSAAAVAVVLVGVFGVRLGMAWRERARMVPLDLPGSALVRGPEWQVAGYRFLALNLSGQRTFLTLPGMNSLYGWAGVDYPSGFNCTENFALLSPAEQRTLVEVGRRCAPVAMVYSEELFQWWVQHHGPPTGLLVEFLRQECQPLGHVQEYTLLRFTEIPGEALGWRPDILTGCAVVEQSVVNGEPQPTGRIRVAAAPFSPSDALLVDLHGTVVLGPLKITTLLSEDARSFHSVLTLTEPALLRAHPADQLCLRLRDERGRRLTTVPFYTPAETSR